MTHWSHAIKTVEFRIDAEISHHWLDGLTRVWNESLDILNWHQHYKRATKYECLNDSPYSINVRKIGDVYAPNCTIAREFRRDIKKSWNKQNIVYRPCCDIINPKYLTPPPINKPSAIDLRKCFAKKRCDWLQDSDIPSIYVNDFIGLTVIPAWEAYLKGKRYKPRYKGRKNRVTSLISSSFRAACAIKDNEMVRLPGMLVKVSGINKRLLQPINKMVADMGVNPDNYPLLKKKEEERIKKGEDKEEAIEYFKSPGAFCLLQRDGKTYLQITAYMPVKVQHKQRSVGVDIGLDYLVHTTSELKIKHKEYIKEYARIDTLQQKLSTKKYGSKNYIKLSEKINRIHGKIKRSRRKHHQYIAQQIADVNDNIAIKKLNIKDTFENPLPKTTRDGETYLPNGKEEARMKNQEIASCSLGQFTDILKTTCTKKRKYLEKVEIEAESTPAEILEVSSILPSVGAISKPAPSFDAGEGERVTISKSAGKGQPTGFQFMSVANPPVQTTQYKRKRKRENAIG